MRMLNVVAGYGGGVCLSMRWGTPAILAVCDRANQSDTLPWLECLILIWTSRRKMSPTMRMRRYFWKMLNVTARVVIAETLHAQLAS